MDDEPKMPLPTLPKVHEKNVGFFGKVKKAAWRSLFGTIMMSLFGYIIYLGHLYLCMLVFFLQCCLFAELVGVRKKLAAERKMPLFRSIQWAWFFVASFFTWSDSIFNYVRENPLMAHRWSSAHKTQNLASFMLRNSIGISFGLYSTLLMVSVTSLRKGLYRYQMTQYTWTLMTCCIIVFQMRAAFHNIYAGIFWFVVPCSLVICNDIMAYFCGVFLGRKIIKRPFLQISPNKTWEGFIGAAGFTIAFAFFFARFLSGYDWAICAPEDISFEVRSHTCTPATMFKAQPVRAVVDEIALSLGVPLGDIVFDKMPVYLPSWCSDTLLQLSRSPVSFAQLHAMSLALFASVVAPFGGFLASAIKRAYGIKDFNNVIPGHGGVMDRFDCQFIMCMCTYVHHFTFVRQTEISVDALLASVAKLSPEARQQFVEKIQQQFVG